MILFLLLLFAPLAAQPERYFEAKEYAKALDLYEGLSKQPLTPWQKNVIAYNKGTVLLSAKDYKGAIDQFLAIPDPFPVLARRIYTNIAVAKLLQEEQIELNSVLAYEKAAFLLYEALAYTKRAVKAECAQQRLEGAKSCMPAKDLKIIEARIQEKFRAFKQIPKFTLLDSYELALLDDPLQEEALTKLLEEQKKKGYPTEDLTLSLKALQQNEPLLARFYLQKARFQLTKDKSVNTPQQILELALEHQHEALVLNRLAERSERKEGEMSEAVEQAQQEAVTAATLFKEAVFQQQMLQFSEPGPLSERCQEQPWLTLLPLFDEGFLLAQSSPTVSEQEQIADKWNLALKQFQKPKEPFKGSCTVEQEKEEEEKPQAVPLSQVLKNMQKMEQEEQQPAKPVAPPKGERPW